MNVSLMAKRRIARIRYEYWKANESDAALEGWEYQRVVRQETTLQLAHRLGLPDTAAALRRNAEG